MTLPTTTHSFQPASGRAWLVRFWQLDAKYVGIAFPFGVVLFILFYFDANVSVSCQLSSSRQSTTNRSSRSSRKAPSSPCVSPQVSTGTSSFWASRPSSPVCLVSRLPTVSSPRPPCIRPRWWSWAMTSRPSKTTPCPRWRTADRSPRKCRTRGRVRGRELRSHAPCRPTRLA